MQDKKLMTVMSKMAFICLFGANSLMINKILLSNSLKAMVANSGAWVNDGTLLRLLGPDYDFPKIIDCKFISRHEQMLYQTNTNLKEGKSAFFDV